MLAHRATEIFIMVVRRGALTANLPALRKIPDRRAHRIRATGLPIRRAERVAQNGLVRVGNFGRLRQYRHVVLCQPCVNHALTR